MTDSEIFDMAIKKYGGEIRPPLRTPDSGFTIWGFTKQIADDLIASLRKFIPRLPEIYVGFINNGDLNAAAFSAGDRYFIGVYIGTAYLFYSVFGRMLSDRRVLPRVGNPGLEDESPQPLRGIDRDAYRTFANGIAPSEPKCPDRAFYAKRLFEDAMNFLFLHELTHIAAGDAGYVNRSGDSSIFLELPVAGNDKIKISDPDMLNLQSMEMNADTQASIWSVNNARLHALEKPPMTLGDSIFRRVFAICAFFRMFGDTFFTVDFLERDHPHHRFRQVLTITRVWQAIAGLWPKELHDVALAAINSATHEVESTFSLLTGEPLAMDGLEEAQSEYGVAYLKMLETNYFNVVIPLLKPYAHFDWNRLTPGFNQGQPLN